MTSDQHAAQLNAVRASSILADSTPERHGCYPKRRPVYCMVCEHGTTGHMCGKCREDFMAKAAA